MASAELTSGKASESGGGGASPAKARNKASLKRKNDEASSGAPTPAPETLQENAVRIHQKRTQAPISESHANHGKKSRTLNSALVHGKDVGPGPEAEPDGRSNLNAGGSSFAMPSPSEMTGLQLYWHLASTQKEVREKAAANLVSELFGQQKEFLDGNSGPNSRERTAESDIPGCQNYSPSLIYALRRLVRGLSSPRDCARQGFAVALTNLLSSLPIIEVISIQKLIEKHLVLAKSAENQEYRDTNFGRIFAYGCIARSGRFESDINSGGEKKSVAHDAIKHMTVELINLASQKYFYSQPSVSIIVDLIDQLDPEDVKSTILSLPTVVNFLKVKVEVASADQLLLALKLIHHISDELKPQIQLIPEKNSISNLFSKEHLEKLSFALKNSTASHPKIHTVWNVLIQILFFSSHSRTPPNLELNPSTKLVEKATDSSKAKSKSNSKKSKSSEQETNPVDGGKDWTKGSRDLSKELTNFWEVIVESHLLDSSNERRNLAFEVFHLLLPHLSINHIPQILSKPFIQSLISPLSKNSALLHHAASKFMERLIGFCEERKEMKWVIISSLQVHPKFKFHLTSKNSRFKKLLEVPNLEESKQFIEFLFHSFLNPPTAQDEEKDEENFGESDTPSMDDSFRRSIVEQLYSFCSHNYFPPSDKIQILKEVFLFLAPLSLLKFDDVQIHGMKQKKKHLLEKFRIHSCPSLPLSATIIQLCQSRCLSILERLLHSPPVSPPVLQVEKKSREEGNGSSEAMREKAEENSFTFLLEFLSETVKDLSDLTNVEGVEYINEIDDSAQNDLTQLRSAIGLLAKDANDSEKNFKLRKNSICLLLSILFFHVAIQPHSYTDAISDLLSLSSRLFPNTFALNSKNDKSSKSTRKSKKELSQEEGEGKMEEEYDNDGSIGKLEPMNVLVDILLSLLSNATSPLCSAIQIVFRAFSQDLTTVGISDILNVISRSFEKQLEEELVEGEEDEETLDESDEVEEGTEDDDEEDGDEDEEEEEEEEEGEEEEEEEEELKVIKSIRGETNESIGKSQKKRKGKSQDEDDEDEEDFVMDDDAMFSMDHHLSQIFKQKKEEISGGKKSKMMNLQLLAFKSRALNLIEIFVRKCRNSPFIIQIATSLLSVLSKANSTSIPTANPFYVRVENILKKYIFNYRPDFTGSSETDTSSELTKALEHVLDLAVKTKSKTASNSAGACSLWIVKSMKPMSSRTKEGVEGEEKVNSNEDQKNEGNEIKSILANIFSSSLIKASNRKHCHLKISFYGDVLKRYPWMAASFLPTLVSNSISHKNKFIQSDSLEFLGNMFQIRPIQHDFISTVRSNIDNLQKLILDLISTPRKARMWFSSLNTALAIVQFLPSISTDESTPLDQLVNLNEMRSRVDNLSKSDTVPSKKISSALRTLNDALAKASGKFDGTSSSERKEKGPKEKVMSNRKKIRLEKERRKKEMEEKGLGAKGDGIKIEEGKAKAKLDHSTLKNQETNDVEGERKKKEGEKKDKPNQKISVSPKGEGKKNPTKEEFRGNNAKNSKKSKNDKQELKSSKEAASEQFENKESKKKKERGADIPLNDKEQRKLDSKDNSNQSSQHNSTNSSVMKRKTDGEPEKQKVKKKMKGEGSNPKMAKDKKRTKKKQVNN